MLNRGIWRKSCFFLIAVSGVVLGDSAPDPTDPLAKVWPKGFACIWSRDFQIRLIENSGWPVGYRDNALVLVNRSGQIVCVDAVTGGIRWSTPSEGPATALKAMGSSMAVITLADRVLQTYDLRNGKRMWEYASPDPVRSLFLEKDRAVFLTGKEVRGLDADRGTLLWTYAITEGGDQLVLDDRVAAVLTCSGTLTALDTERGAQKWEVRFPDLDNPRLAIRSERVLLADDHQGLRVLEAASGRTIWKNQLPSGVQSLFTTPRTVVVTDVHGIYNYLVFDLASGKRLCGQSLDEDDVTSVVEVEDYLVATLCGDHTFLVFDLKQRIPTAKIKLDAQFYPLGQEDSSLLLLALPEQELLRVQLSPLALAQQPTSTSSSTFEPLGVTLLATAIAVAFAFGLAFLTTARVPILHVSFLYRWVIQGILTIYGVTCLGYSVLLVGYACHDSFGFTFFRLLAVLLLGILAPYLAGLKFFFWR